MSNIAKTLRAYAGQDPKRLMVEAADELDRLESELHASIDEVMQAEAQLDRALGEGPVLVQAAEMVVDELLDLRAKVATAPPGVD